MSLVPVFAAATATPIPDTAEAVTTTFPEAAASAAAVSGGLDYWALILHASLPVQLVMLLLLAASVVSWVIIFRKRRVFVTAFEEVESFEDKFWSGVDLGQLYRNASERNREVHGMEAIFESGFREFGRLSKKRAVDSRTQLEGAQRAMRAQLSREVDGLEDRLELLASIGSVSPYVGLFGTVWGIMISFHGLAQVQEATIATVAPGISEALIATAMGLFAAIPAVVAYNRYATKVERIAVRYEAFAEEFSSILQRQAHLDDE